MDDGPETVRDNVRYPSRYRESGFQPISWPSGSMSLTPMR